MRDLAADADLLRQLHHGPVPLLLANVWDAAGARMVQELGLPAVATSSGAVAASFGYDDGEAMPAEVAFAAVERVARAVDIPVTADIEAGYALGPDALVDCLLRAGAVGCNLEDSDHGNPGALVAAVRHAERVHAVMEAARARGVELVVNARVDVHLLGVGDPDTRLPEMVRRGRLYLDAGATCVFPIGVSDEATIRALVKELDGPVNVFLRPGAPTLATLAEMGVARISVGSTLYRSAMRAARATAEELVAEHNAIGR